MNYKGYEIEIRTNSVKISKGDWHTQFQNYEQAIDWINENEFYCNGVKHYE